MKKRFSLIIVSGIIISTLFSSISAFAFSNSNNITNSEIDERQGFHQNKLKNMVMGKVTAIDGNNITIVKAEKPDITETDGERPERPEKPDITETDRERPQRPDRKSFEDGEKPELSQEELENIKENINNRKNKMEFTGEEITITVDDESIIKLMEIKFDKNKDNTDEKETGNINDIEVGSIINILYSDESDNSEIKEIMVRKFDAVIEDITTTGAAF